MDKISKLQIKLVIKVKNSRLCFYFIFLFKKLGLDFNIIFVRDNSHLLRIFTNIA